jgi:hypothetical protein
MSQANLFAFGCHGRAWQLLVLQLEESFAALLSLPLELKRRGSLIHHLKVGDALPTPHNLEGYKLCDGLADRKGGMYKLHLLSALIMLRMWLMGTAPSQLLMESSLKSLGGL